MGSQLIRVKCAQCGGDGLVTTYLDGGISGEITCPTCFGSGKMVIGEIDLSDLIEAIGSIEVPELPENVVRAHELFEAIDQVEYDALSGNDEKECDKVLALATIDLSAAGRARAILWGIFDDQSTTRANILALIS